MSATPTTTKEFKLIFDATCLMPDRLSGVGVYAQNLFMEMERQMYHPQPVIMASRLLKDSHVQEHIKKEAKPFWPLPSFKKSKNSIFHGPDFRLMAGSGGYLRVVTIHDLAVFHRGFNAESFRSRGQAMIKKLIAQRPDHIVVPSLEVAREVKDLFPQVADRVTAIYHGVDHLRQQKLSLVTDPYAGGGYFLYVGHIEKRKNVGAIVDAFNIVAEKNPDVKLVLVGKNGFAYKEILQKIAGSPHRKRIVQPGFVTNDQLFDLYKNALGFLFPSFYEGFGFPILEAMLIGSPVITSNLGTMKEVAGDAALFADPDSPEDLAQQMMSICSSSTLRDELVAKGKAHAEPFTWEKSALQYGRVYYNLLG